MLACKKNHRMAHEMKYLFATLLILLTSSNFAQSADTNWYRLEIGFNLDYPDRVHFFEPALAEIKQLGVRDIYIHEIFDGKHGNEYQVRLKDALDRLLKYEMRPMICISNAHARLQLGEEVKKQAIKELPLQVAKRIKQHLTYTNRFPPNDWNAYRASIQELVDFLFSTYGRKQVQDWLFEVGNEPDAPLFYWGNQQQYAKMFSIAVDVLHRNGIRNVGGPGLTHHSIFLNDATEYHHKLYHDFLKNDICNMLPDGFMSFHLFREDTERPLKSFPEWLANTQCRVMITGWNVSSRGKIAVKTFEQPGAWGTAFIHLLADSARYGIDRLYIFKLMDYSPHNTYQLGAFDRNGKAKSWYLEFAALWHVVRDGYRVVENEKVLTIEGINGQRVILPLDHELEVSLPIVYAPSDISGTAIKIQPGEWVIVSGKTKNLP